jgi:hypothetical protein
MVLAYTIWKQSFFLILLGIGSSMGSKPFYYPALSGVQGDGTVLGRINAH